MLQNKILDHAAFMDWIPGQQAGLDKGNIQEILPSLQEMILLKLFDQQ